jgi:hypothetical protein
MQVAFFAMRIARFFALAYRGIFGVHCGQHMGQTLRDSDLNFNPFFLLFLLDR